MNITYRSNTSGALTAVYSGDCRIGYIERRANDRWRWQLSIVMPGGGYGLGVCDDEISAKEDLFKAYQFWMTSAGLRPIKEQTDDTRSPELPLRLAPQLDPGAGKEKSKPRPRDSGLLPRRPAAPAKRARRSKANG